MDRTVWIAAAVALALGAGIGFAAGIGIGSRGSGEEPLVVGGPAEPGPSASAAGSPGEASSPGGAGSPGGPNGAPAAAPGRNPTALGRALAEIPPPEVAAGSGVIRGTVKTEDGTPVAGVLVRAMQNSRSGGAGEAWRHSGAPPPEEDLETEVRRSIDSSRRWRAARRDATTGPDGAFAIEGLADLPHFVSAFKEGYEFSSKSRTNNVRPGSVVEFTAKPLVEVPVDVLLADGTRPAEASILVSEKREGREYRQWSSTHSREWSPDRSLLWIAPGAYSLVAETGDDDEEGGARSAPQEVTLEAGKACPCVVLRLKEPVGIRGKVVLPADWIVSSVQVHCLPVPPGQEPDPERLRSEGKTAHASAENGYAFTFKDLAPGSYRVGVSLFWRRIAASTAVEVSDRMAAAELVVAAPGPGECLVVRALAPDDRPVPDVQFQVYLRSGRSTRSTGSDAVSRKDGSYLVFVRDPEAGHGEDGKDEGAKHSLLATSKKYGAKEVEFDPVRQAELEVRFQEPAFVEATILGYAGSGFEGRAFLELRPRAKGNADFERRFGPGDRDAKIDAEGRQTLGPVEPGAYDLVLKVGKGGRDRGWGAWPVQRAPLQIGPGNTKASIQIPPLHTLIVVVEKAAPGTTIQLSVLKPGEPPEATMPLSEKTGKDRRATFDLLPAGEYRLMIWEGEVRGQMNVSVPATSVAVFEPQVINSLKVHLTDPQGTLGQAGFREGDLIIGLEGKEFTNEADMQLIFAASLSNKQAKFIVLRGGTRLEISMDPSAFMKDPEKLGGTFDPAAR